MAAHIALIVNPVSGGRRAQKLRAHARAALGCVAPVVDLESWYPGHESELAVQAASEGARAIVVLGGDGTLSNVVHGLRQRGCDVPIAILAAGTGNDFAKTIGAPVGDPPATAELIARKLTQRIDAGVVDGRTFINAVGFGFDSEVLNSLRKKTILPRILLYASTAVPMLFTYRGIEAAVHEATVHEATIRPGKMSRYFTVVLANGCWFGGVFRIAPAARADDGVLDCIAISDTNPFRRVALFSRAIFGKHVDSPLVAVTRGEDFELHFPAPPHFQYDGEAGMASSGTVRVSVLRNAVEIFAQAAPPASRGRDRA